MLVSVGDSETVRVNANKEFRLAQADVIKNKGEKELSAKLLPLEAFQQ